MSSGQSLARRSLEACRNQLFFENRFFGAGIVSPKMGG